MKILISQVKSEKKSHVEQHKSTAMHVANSARRKKKCSNSKQILFTNLTTEIAAADNFNLRLCQALVSENASWHVFSNPTMKNFLEDISGRKISHESKMHKNYLTPVYQKTMDKTSKNIDDNYTWCSVDETADSCGRFIVNVLLESWILMYQVNLTLFYVQYDSLRSEGWFTHFVARRESG